jgi:hypothetical protein
MPALAYAVTYELSDGTIVHFIGIDTNILVNVGDDGQAPLGLARTAPQRNLPAATS